MWGGQTGAKVPARPQTSKGVRDPSFQRTHAAMLARHDQEYIERHKLGEALDAAWKKCLKLKPLDPRRFIAEQLSPASTTEAVLALQKEIAELKVKLPAQHQSPFPDYIRVLSDESISYVQRSFDLVFHDPAFEYELHRLIEDVSPSLLGIVKSFEDQVPDATYKLLPLLRLVVDHLKKPSAIEGYVRGAARLYVRAGVALSDFDTIANAMLGSAEKTIRRESERRDHHVKCTWVKLQSLISMAMAAGGDGQRLHTTHQLSFAMKPEELDLLRKSMAKVTDWEAAANTLARHTVDLLGPEGAEVLKARSMGLDAFGKRLMEGAGMVIDMLEQRGVEGAVSFLTGLGRMHAGFGVKTYMYPAIGQALLSALHHSLQADTAAILARTLAAWREAMGLFVRLLKSPTPGLAGQLVHSADTTRQDIKGVEIDVEEDLVELVKGVAESSTGPVLAYDGDSIEVSHLRKLFAKYDTEEVSALPRDRMVAILQSQESFGVPISKKAAEKAVDDLLAKQKSDAVNYEAFSILMLQLARR